MQQEDEKRKLHAVRMRGGGGANMQQSNGIHKIQGGGEEMVTATTMPSPPIMLLRVNPPPDNPPTLVIDADSKEKSMPAEGNDANNCGTFMQVFLWFEQKLGDEKL